MRTQRFSATVFVFVLCVALPFSGATPTFAASTTPDTSTAILGDGITQQIAEDGKANVLVSLDEYTIDELESPTARKELKDDQNDIIDDADLNINKTKKLDHVPLITTTVNKEQLTDLVNDPRVDDISLDHLLSVDQFDQERETGFESLARPMLDHAVPILGADDAWAATTPITGTGQSIAIVDTGINKNHPFLSGAVVDEACFASGPNGAVAGGSCPNGQNSQTGSGSGVACTTNSSCYHGTHVAGIAAGRRSISSAPVGGIAPSASLISIQVFSEYSDEDDDDACSDRDTSSPCIFASNSDIAGALNWIVANHTEVASINMSLGYEYSGSCDGQTSSITSTVATLRNTYGIATVVASGNASNKSKVSWPACLSNAIAVGATSTQVKLNVGNGNCTVSPADTPDVVAGYSNSSSEIDLWAPGSCIKSSYSGSSYAYLSGTSMASPMIAGAFALLAQAHSSESVTQLLSRLQSSGIDVTDASNSVTKRRPDVGEAISMSLPSAPSAPTNFVLSAKTGYGQLTWTAGAGATGYVIYDKNGALVKTLGAVTTTTVTTKANQSNLFSIASTNATGTSSSVVSNTVTGKADPATNGYSLFASNAAVISKGSLAAYSHGGFSLNKPIVGGAVDPQRRGVWSVASDGGIFTTGKVKFYGSTGGMKLNQPIVGMTATASGNGYWMVASDGGIFSFGDAKFRGSTGGMKLNKPIVGMASTITGKGYWLVASDGGIFSFGDAKFRGSTGGMKLNKPIVGMTATATGKGYWMVASDGGIFSFGDAKFRGSTGGINLSKPIVGMRTSVTGGGYWLFCADGQVFPFGDAPNLGSGVGSGYTFTRVG